MINPHRGDAGIEIDGSTHCLRLTLCALANLETAFDAPDLGTLTAHLLAPGLTSERLRTVLREALMAGENMRHEEAEALLNKAASTSDLMRAYVRLMHATFAP